MPDDEKKKFECNGCQYATANKCKLFHQSCAMMETMFWSIRRCCFKHMPERKEIMDAVTTAIDTCSYPVDGIGIICTPQPVKIMVEKALEDLLWLPKE
jgi:hypothetical protein